TNSTDDLYYKTVGLTVHSEGSFQIFTTINPDVPDGTVISNAATIVCDGPEEYLLNNTDDTTLTVWLPDLTVRKLGRDTASGSYDLTEEGHFVEYNIEYNNIGNQSAENSVIDDTLPDGTTFHSATTPSGVTYTQLTDSVVQFDLGTLTAPAATLGVPENICLSQFGSRAVELANGMNGMSTNLERSDYFGISVAPAGDIDGDSAPERGVGALGRDGGGQDGYNVDWMLLMNANGTVKTNGAIELA
ncbi:MAG: DUF11 domain-containing protein, partial [bacterium]|nr:DUF11 domain-containing protein [bacterium]